MKLQRQFVAKGEILSSTVRQQIIHSDYGGVIPEMFQENTSILNKVVNIH